MTTTFAAALLDEMAPWTTGADDHGKYLTALAQAFEQVFSLAMDQGDPDDPAWIPGWSQLLDVDACPTAWLPYLAQFNGTDLPTGTDDATARAIIRAESGQQRGTPASIVAAAKRLMTGTQTVTLFERTAADGSTPDAYHFCLVVLTSESANTAGIIAAVDSVRPGGVQWTLIQTSTWTIAQFELAYASVTLAEAAFSTVSHLETDVLG